MKLKEDRPLYILKEIAAILRSDNGCPWDREQTHASLKSCLIEETYEVYEAIEKNDSDDLREELGDLLYQVYAHSQMAEERGEFTIDDVANDINEKLIRRHPHVFGTDTADTSDAVLKRWEEIKKEEKSHRTSILDGIPSSLPALMLAYKMQKKASRVGFDWGDISGALSKLDEEICEFKESLRGSSQPHITEEAGDILFSLVNVLRFVDVDAEEALRLTADKFSRRFRYIEQRVSADGRDLNNLSLEEMDLLWNEAKAKEK